MDFIKKCLRKLKSKSSRRKDVHTIVRSPASKYIEDDYVLSTLPWYWPDLSGQAAEQMLTNQPNGTFLARRSFTQGFVFTITYKVAGNVGSLRVHCKNGVFSLSFADPKQPNGRTLQELIENWIKASREGYVCGLKRVTNGVVDLVPFTLTRPFPRSVTLQEHCRRVIMRSLRDKDEVSQLPLPKQVTAFLLRVGA